MKALKKLLECVAYKQMTHLKLSLFLKKILFEITLESFSSCVFAHLTKNLEASRTKLFAFSDDECIR